MRYFQEIALSVQGKRGRPANHGPIYVQTAPPAGAGLPVFETTHTLVLNTDGGRRLLTLGRFGNTAFIDAYPASYAPTQTRYEAGTKRLLVTGGNLLADCHQGVARSDDQDLRTLIERTAFLAGDTLYFQVQMPHIVIRLPVGAAPAGKVFLSSSRDWDLADHTLFALDDWPAAMAYIEQVRTSLWPGAHFEMELAGVTVHTHAAAADEPHDDPLLIDAGASSPSLSPPQATLALAAMSGSRPYQDCTTLPAQVSDLLARDGWWVGADGFLVSPEAGHRTYAVRFAHTVADNGAVIDCTGYLICRKAFYPSDILCLQQSLVGAGQVERFVRGCHEQTGLAA